VRAIVYGLVLGMTCPSFRRYKIGPKAMMRHPLTFLYL
jgi:hypothetical protein